MIKEVEILSTIRWGIIGCGDVCEVKSGPGFQKASSSELVMVMRRDSNRAKDFAERHQIPKWTDQAQEVVDDPDVDAVYIATPPSSHCELALKVADSNKPCLVEKPMAINHKQCIQMTKSFHTKNIPLFVAYYRRELPRFLKVKELLQAGVIGKITSVHIVQYGPLAVGKAAQNWRYDPEIAGAGVFLDLASHGLDILDFILGPISKIQGFSVNTGGRYKAEDVTGASMEFESGCIGTGIWNFHADHSGDQIIFTGAEGELKTPVFSNTDIILKKNGQEKFISAPNPLHVHQPLIQTIVDQLLGNGRCTSTGDSGARTSWAMDQCLVTYYGSR